LGAIFFKNIKIITCFVIVICYNIINGRETRERKNMKMTKQDKELVREQYAKVWHRRDGSIDEKMVEYCTKKTSGYVMLGETMVTFDKPSIKTDFWFGEHTWDYDEVCERADNCSKSESYFIAENIADFKWRLEKIDDSSWSMYVCPRGYCSQDEDCVLGCVEFARWGEQPRSVGAREMTDEERMAYRGFLAEEQEKFEKRLRTYLKRYGLSKCHYGVYWADR